MNKKTLLKRLNDVTIDAHERESLSQLLHYMTVENIQDTQHTTTTNKPKQSKRTKHKPNKR